MTREGSRPLHCCSTLGAAVCCAAASATIRGRKAVALAIRRGIAAVRAVARLQLRQRACTAARAAVELDCTQLRSTSVRVETSDASVSAATELA